MAEIKCPKCGKINNADATFCSHCGTALHNNYTNFESNNENIVYKNKKSILETIFGNVDVRIKILSIFLLIIGILSSLIYGFYLIDNEMVGIGVLTMIFGTIFSYIGAMFVFAFGEIVFRRKQASINTKIIALSITERNGHDYNYLLEQIEEEERL